MGVPKWVLWPRANAAIGAIGGSAHGAARRSMGRATMGAVGAGERSHWGRWWSALLGFEAFAGLPNRWSSVGGGPYGATQRARDVPKSA
eukprot:5981591-Pyramimonas_sp.AAC.1